MRNLRAVSWTRRKKTPLLKPLWSRVATRKVDSEEGCRGGGRKMWRGMRGLRIRVASASCHLVRILLGSNEGGGRMGNEMDIRRT